jgi:hypothetical protein
MPSDHLVNPTDPADPVPPTSPEQALDIVRSRYAQPRLPDGTPAELRVEEFDIGYPISTEISAGISTGRNRRCGALGSSSRTARAAPPSPSARTTPKRGHRSSAPPRA